MRKGETSEPGMRRVDSRLFCDRLSFSRTPTKTELRIITSARVGIRIRIRMTHEIQARRSGVPELRTYALCCHLRGL